MSEQDNLSEIPTTVEDAEGLSLVLDTYWPVIEEARKVRERYTPVVEEGGKKKRKATVVCPDETAAMIEALNTAEETMLVERNETEPEETPS